MRETSIEGYRFALRSGLVGKKQQDVYRALSAAGPSTAQELSREISGAWKRLSELRDMGMVCEVGKRTCRVTGRQSIVWDVPRNHQLSFIR